MRLVKLNKTHKAFKELGHRWAFRWDSYDVQTCPRVEQVFYDIHGSQYMYKAGAWKSTFGYAVRNKPRPYWVSFTNESDAALVLLKVDVQ